MPDIFATALCLIFFLVGYIYGFDTARGSRKGDE
jgi:hypothetical protein